MKKKIVLIIVILLIILVLGIGVSFLLLKKDDRVDNDAIKFKKEYESLNNTVRESDKALYNNVNIASDNPIKYVSVEKAINLLNSEKAIIYIGANWCPWCRNMLAPMFDVAKELNIDTIYYLELDDDKSTYEIEDGKLKKVSNGSSSYYTLLDKLKDYLKDYELEDSEGNLYPTGEKRIYMPFFITVRNESIVEAKEISRTLEEGQTKYSDMTDNQYHDLYDEFYKTFSKIYSADGSCSVEEKCN